MASCTFDSENAAPCIKSWSTARWSDDEERCAEAALEKAIQEREEVAQKGILPGSFPLKRKTAELFDSLMGHSSPRSEDSIFQKAKKLHRMSMSPGPSKAEPSKALHSDEKPAIPEKDETHESAVFLPIAVCQAAMAWAVADVTALSLYVPMKPVIALKSIEELVHKELMNFFSAEAKAAGASTEDLPRMIVIAREGSLELEVAIETNLCSRIVGKAQETIKRVCTQFFTISDDEDALPPFEVKTQYFNIGGGRRATGRRYKRWFEVNTLRVTL